MNEVNTAKDGRPDVEIKLRAYPSSDPRVAAEVAGDAVCRFGCGSLHSPDPRTMVKWADEHESTLSHAQSKKEYLEEEKRKAEALKRPPMDTPWYKD